MSELVSSFLDVQLGKQKYLFFLITWADYVTKLSKVLDEQWQAFGADLGPRGSVIRAYQQHAKNSFEEVMAKPWPKEIRKRFDNEQDPFILVIDRDFAVFKPGEHPWAIICMSDFYNEPERIDRAIRVINKTGGTRRKHFRICTVSGPEAEGKESRQVLSAQTWNFWGFRRYSRYKGNVARSRWQQLINTLKNCKARG